MSRPERVGVVGQRDYPDPAQVEEFVASLPPGTVVVTGCCPTGVDAAARRAARRAPIAQRLGLKVHRARWGDFGRQAGPRRNACLVADIDRLVAFYVPGSREPGKPDGTMNCVHHATGRGVPVEMRQPRPAPPVE